jgi:hypothetical protein
MLSISHLAIGFVLISSFKGKKSFLAIKVFTAMQFYIENKNGFAKMFDYEKFISLAPKRRWFVGKVTLDDLS